MNGERELGDQIRRVRKSRGLTQMAFAEKIGISLSHLSDLENGKSGFSVSILQRITEVLQVSADSLLRTNIKEVGEIYHSEIQELLQDCTPAELASILRILQTIKGEMRSISSGKNNNDFS